ncbi:OLC1v1002606C1 [Oldenlandia corymbosa var. corymbosa]|uniref:OLC1v1002606C1 n=1 Tax=Oldenlandia corymbosa var. corymbosa TaxID=529605 RepID=A0AAV1DAH8_OLDCO|nr:OLC1v1002606C1 [Oldenlandia corymbosa var. corymbosa]
MAFAINCKMKLFFKHFPLLVHLILLSADKARGEFHGEERQALMDLVSGFNSSFLHHNWTKVMCLDTDPVARWFGIKCLNGRVTGISLENMNLTGKIRPDVLTNIPLLVELSLKNNSISGPMMDFSNNPNLIRIDLSDNRFSGEISSSLLKLDSLAFLHLQNNNLNGSIPPFDQPGRLQFFNVSYNNLSGPIPNTTLLQSMDPSAFIHNQNLCGPPTSTPCPTNSSTDPNPDNGSDPKKHSKKSKLPPILWAVNVVVLVVLLFLFIIYFKKYRKLKKQAVEKQNAEMGTDDQNVNIEGKGKRMTGYVEGESKGKLVFLDGGIRFELDELLRASAEGLGKGNFGNCYKAMLENGPTVVVKRLRDLKPLSSHEFMKQVGIIAEQKHPNLMPLIAYYYSKEEKLLIYKLASNGNAYNRLHEGKGKPSRIPFRWSSRLAVARGVARALQHLHSNTKSSNVAPHGNLKLSNVLLDENDDVLVTDYGLTTLVAAPLAAQRMTAYKSPEYQSSKKVSRKSDVWSYGCLLLELVTGRLSADSAPAGTTAVDLCSWVHRAVREEWTAEIFDVEIAVQRSANHGMLKLLQIAMKCCERSPENRPEINEVVREVESITVVADSEDEEFSSMDPSLTDDSMSATSPRIHNE